MDPKKPVVMIAEDDSDLRWLYKQWLVSAGWHVRTVDDGAWALALIPPDPPDLLLLDLNLPDVDGFDVCRSLKQDPELKRIPVLAMTSQADTVTRDHAHVVGADGFLVKPFSRTELVMQIDSLLGPDCPRPETDPNLHLVISQALSRAGH